MIIDISDEKASTLLSSQLHTLFKLVSGKNPVR